MAFLRRGEARRFLTQTLALTKKNLLIHVKYHWLATFVKAILLPLAFTILILETPNYTTPATGYGIGRAVPVRTVASTLTWRDLIIVQPPYLGPDVSPVVSRFLAVDGLKDYEHLVFVTDESQLAARCPTSLVGASNCHAAVIFHDSPLTPIASGDGSATEGKWNYTIRADAYSGSPNVLTRSGNPVDEVLLPLQVAVDNAILDRSETLETLGFTQTTQKEVDERRVRSYQNTVYNVFRVVLFISYFTLIYHVVSSVASEREQGLSQLVDVMGGSPSARVLSHVLCFDILYLPTWMALGICYWALLFRESNFAICFFWQILTGWAVTSAAVFAASFFRRAQMGGIYVMLAFIGITVGALSYDSDRVRTYIFPGSPPNPTVGGVVGLTLLFPSANFVYQLGLMALFASRGSRIDLADFVPENEDTGPMPYHITLGVLWVFSAIHIVAYPLLAVGVEHLMHGINFKGRRFRSDADADKSAIAVETTSLRKVYEPSLLRKIFCCGRGSTVVAVESLDLVAQKRQVLCLLGANGSGKTTTLELIAGLQATTGGSVAINAPASKLGICPQKNTLWNDLSVREHVHVWNRIKGQSGSGTEDADLIEACDLTSKATASAKTLSGGQKRKLQLACMYSGGSTVCLMDEPTSGLDPLSRRMIWNIVLAERSKRSMILTTHFLDECEVLADHIVIVSHGQLKCQGPAAELKEQHGGGYRVHLPKTAKALPPASLALPRTVHQDQYIYTTRDSRAAAEVMADLEARGERDIFVAGPTIENVFLNVAKDDHNHEHSFRGDDGVVASSHADADDPQQPLSSGTTASFMRQTWTLFRKRATVLRRNWWPYLFAIALPIAVTPALVRVLSGFITQGCLTASQREARGTLTPTYGVSLYSWKPWDGGGYPGFSPEPQDHLFVGPPALAGPLRNVLGNFSIGEGPLYDPNSTFEWNRERAFNLSLFDQDFVFVDDRTTFVSAVTADLRLTHYGGFFVQEGKPSLVAFDAEYGAYGPQTLISLMNQARSGIEIRFGTGDFGYGEEASDFGSFQYAAYFCLIQAVWPALFALYPAYERLQKVRAVQYSNGVRPLPLWTAYTLFDFCFVVAAAVGVTASMAAQLDYWWVAQHDFNGNTTYLLSHWYAVGYMFPVLLLYGLVGVLVAYVFSAVASSQLAAFAFAVAFNAVSFLLSLLTFALENIYSNAAELQRTVDTTTFTLNLIFPVGNVLRAINVGLNIYSVDCRNDAMIAYPGSIYAYGGPILYLFLQCCFLFALVYSLDRKYSFKLLRGRTSSVQQSDSEEALEHKANPDVAEETLRVEQQHVEGADLLQLLHVTKSFGSSNVAVDNVTLGLGDGEILALLGPNGAGKTTMVNMIQGELHPDSGSILVQGIDVSRQTRKAQKHLGVCPQFDALDIMTARQHLEFYARAKGVPDVKRNVDLVMSKVGLTAFGSRVAAKLSGGNKRKLSLAIALIGNPAVLILDEPSSSMDAVAKRAMWKVLAEISPGRSVLLTTHSMEEADALATRAAILSKHLLALGTTQTLRQRYSNVYHVQLILRSAPNSSAEETARVEDWVRRTWGAAAVQFELASLGGQIRFTVPSSSGVHRGGVAGGSDGKDEKTGLMATVVEMPAVESADSTGSEDGVHSLPGPGALAGTGPKSVGLQLIETLEANKDRLGLQYYSIGAATLERVFLGVVRENNVAEEDGGVRKQAWWKLGRGRCGM